MLPGISLANKCLLLFGGAIVLIVLAASSAPWLRMNALVDEGQLELSRQMVATWELLDQSRADNSPGPATAAVINRAGVAARRLSLEQARELAKTDTFIASALKEIESDPLSADVQTPRWIGTTREYRYAKAVRSASAKKADGKPDENSTLEGLVLLERRSFQASRLLLINTVYLLSAGSLVLGLAVLVFYLVTHKLILSPVRALKDTAERVREGNLGIRSEISTGDEFQELAETFNVMLVDLQSGQDQLRSINSALDLKVNELAESNMALYDAAKLKGEFLASISHELRTPLNSIIGFADLLLDVARAEAAAAAPEAPPALAKRLRYLDNIQTAGRTLLEMINSLLEMAKIEAGKVEIHPGKVVLRDACESLIGLIYPLADRKGITLKLEISDDVPVITTDLKKLQQIVFNFLSNAVKFTEPAEKSGKPAIVTLRAERILGAADASDAERVRVSVIDTGPGIPTEEQTRVFEKFHQLDGTHTREHTGTGLGLAIAKELAHILQGEIQLVSDPGRGSMFSVILPREFDPGRVHESRLEAKFRGSLSGRREWA